MNMHHIKTVQKTLEHSKQWLELLEESYPLNNGEKTFALMRATLKTIRDRINPNEAIHMGGQLPILLRGIFFEGWEPGKSPTKIKTSQEFLASVKQYLVGHEDLELTKAVPAAMKVIFEKLGPGEGAEVKSNLPADIQRLLN